MRITQVEYRELVSTDNYSNVCVGAVADVSDYAHPEVGLEALKAWVRKQLGTEKAAQQELGATHSELWQLRQELAQVNRGLDAAKARWEAAKAFLAKHGVELREELPF